MFELPVIPGKWAYGARQRVLAKVLVKKENTFDGIHLTQAGHDAIASAVR